MTKLTAIYKESRTFPRNMEVTNVRISDLILYIEYVKEKSRKTRTNNMYLKTLFKRQVILLKINSYFIKIL